jgi:2-keto-4-pentenoate hydratase
MNPLSEVQTDRSASELAHKIVEARRRHAFLHPEPHEVPRDVADAMRVQEIVMRMTGLSPLGWKVAIRPDGQPVAAPLFDIVEGSGGQFAFVPGCVIEIELCVRMGTDLVRPGQPLTRDQILAAVEGVFLGIEIVRSRLEFPAAHPFPVFLADNLGNAGYVLGPEVGHSALDSVLGQRCLVKHEGTVVVDAPAQHPQSDPLAPLLAYANQLSDFVGGLQRHQFVTTGALCGAIELAGPGLVTATVGDFASIDVRFT